QLVVSLPTALPNGVYVVSWRSLSAIDVHPDEGKYRVFFGVPAVVSDDIAVTSSSQSTSTPLTVLARWWLYLTASVFAGALATWKLVIAPALVTQSGASSVAAARVRRLALVGGVLLLIGSLFAA